MTLPTSDQYSFSTPLLQSSTRSSIISTTSAPLSSRDAVPSTSNGVAAPYSTSSTSAVRSLSSSSALGVPSTIGGSQQPPPYITPSPTASPPVYGTSTSTCIVATASAISCPASNGTMYTPVGDCVGSDASYMVQCDVTYDGGGLIAIAGIGTVEECIEQCTGDDTCIAVAFDPDTGSCYEQSSVIFGSVTASPGIIFAFNVRYVVVPPNSYSSPSDTPASTSSGAPYSTPYVSTVSRSTLATSSSFSEPSAVPISQHCPEDDGKNVTIPDGTWWVVGCGREYDGTILILSNPKSKRQEPGESPADGCLDRCQENLGCEGFTHRDETCVLYSYISGNHSATLGFISGRRRIADEVRISVSSSLQPASTASAESSVPVTSSSVQSSSSSPINGRTTSSAQQSSPSSFSSETSPSSSYRSSGTSRSTSPGDESALSSSTESSRSSSEAVSSSSVEPVPSSTSISLTSSALEESFSSSEPAVPPSSSSLSMFPGITSSSSSHASSQSSSESESERSWSSVAQVSSSSGERITTSSSTLVSSPNEEQLTTLSSTASLDTTSTDDGASTSQTSPFMSSSAESVFTTQISSSLSSQTQTSTSTQPSPTGTILSEAEAQCPRDDRRYVLDNQGELYQIGCSSDTAGGSIHVAGAPNGFKDCFALCDNGPEFYGLECGSFAYAGALNGVGGGNCYFKGYRGADTAFVPSDQNHVGAIRILPGATTSTSATVFSSTPGSTTSTPATFSSSTQSVESSASSGSFTSVRVCYRGIVLKTTPLTIYYSPRQAA